MRFSGNVAKTSFSKLFFLHQNPLRLFSWLLIQQCARCWNSYRDYSGTVHFENENGAWRRLRMRSSIAASRQHRCDPRRNHKLSSHRKNLTKRCFSWVPFLRIRTITAFSSRGILRFWHVLRSPSLHPCCIIIISTPGTLFLEKFCFSVFSSTCANPSFRWRNWLFLIFNESITQSSVSSLATQRLADHCSRCDGNITWSL